MCPSRDPYTTHVLEVKGQGIWKAMAADASVRTSRKVVDIFLLERRTLN